MEWGEIESGNSTMKIIDSKKIKNANIKALKSMFNILPMILGVMLLISIITVLIPKSFYSRLFSGNLLIDSPIGALLGSILAGNPITGYILGSGLLKNGISLIAVTSFITAWTTVGVIQLPVESSALGTRFAIIRNITAFLLSIIVGILVVLIMQLF